MSLFQAREWWAVSAGDQEEYTHGAIAIGNIDNDTEHHHLKIVVGSLHGMLRVYYPTQAEFKIEHLLLEEQLEHPILQVEVGNFIPHCKLLGIAVLHPKMLVVYMLEGVGGSGMAASYFKLTKKYEHHLGIDGEHFTAYNMTFGHFGGTKDKDQLVVQALDGRLQFFEQDRFAFMQQLSTCLVPGALTYAESIDSILTASSDLCIECYRYQILATSLLKKKKNDEEDAKGVTAAKSLHAEWRTNLGEAVLDIKLGRFSAMSKTFDIVVLCEFTLFCLRPSGEIVFQKRLGFHPSAATLYLNASRSDDELSSQCNIILGTHAKQWMIYNGANLIWSAVSPTVSTALAVGEMGGIPGMIVSLDDEGHLSVSYLGTDPPSSTVVAASDTKEINYEEMDEEHRTLLNIIRRSQGERRTEPKERILIRAQVPAIFDATSQQHDEEYAKGNRAEDDIVLGPDQNPLQITMRVYVTYTGSNIIPNVTLAITVPQNVVLMSESTIHIDAVDGRSSTPLIIPVLLRPSSRAMPLSLEVTISAAYTLESGQPRTSICIVKLPMCMMCRLVPPVKTSTFKFTLDTNQAPPLLADLFQDMLTQPGSTTDWAKQVTGSAANVLSFQYYNGIEVTILVSKNAGRYRIQSSELDALWMVSNELVERLQLLYEGSGEDQTPLEIQYQDPLPLADFFGAIDEHFQLRKSMNDLKAEINDRAHEFRVIQKRLLVRFKDRNPSPLNALDLLLHNTYHQILELSKQMEATQNKLELAANRLSCSVSLLLMLMRYKFALDGPNFSILASHLSPIISNEEEMGWEEMTEAAVTELLKTSLKSGNRESTSVLAPEIGFLPDTKKLKKHITIVCDRLGKGALFVGNRNKDDDENDAKGSD